MARPSRCRRICAEPAYDSFIPEGIAGSERVVLTLDEYEVIRLIDLEKLTHEQCAQQMDISRTTVTEVYETARGKIADSLVNGKPLLIAGGNYRFCDGFDVRHCRKNCRRAGLAESECDQSGGRRPGSTGTVCADGAEILQMKGERTMRIAVTYEDGQVFQHFGHTEQFKVYDIEDGKIVKEQVVDTNGQGHGALAGFLNHAQAEVLICGGIGGGAQAALADAGIKLFGGVTGSADEAVKAYLAGNLGYNPDVHCDHHEHEAGHSCGEHHCGEEKHGCAGH
ncbi:MAG: DUF134 domain-containing protein [Lachnospiraceae bacterium]|nr:DUF134 domain-containing protein [Lachnospiraceae bacterium]